MTVFLLEGNGGSRVRIQLSIMRENPSSIVASARLGGGAMWQVFLPKCSNVSSEGELVH